MDLRQRQLFGLGLLSVVTLTAATIASPLLTHAVQSSDRVDAARAPLRDTAQLWVSTPELSFGSPLQLELSIESHAAATVVWGEPSWERWSDSEQRWVAQVNPSPQDPVVLTLEANAAHVRRLRVPPNFLAAMQPGSWRVRLELKCGASQLQTPWAQVLIREHAVNRALIAGELGSEALEAWSTAVTGLPLLQLAAAPAGGMGSRLAPDEGERRALALAQLRQLHVAEDLALAAERVVLERELNQSRASSDPTTRRSRARELLGRVEHMLSRTPASATPLAGARGELLELAQHLLPDLDEPAAAELTRKIREEHPRLGQRLK